MENSVGIQKMLSDLRALGVRPGGCLLVHSSYKSLGEPKVGIEEVIDSLLSAVGESGTLLMPTLSYESVNSDHPFFDIRSTPSCVGAIPELFRHRPSVLRSLSPTHSVTALGPAADMLLGEHHLDNTPVGSHSPFRKLRDMGGQILLLGCGLEPNTSMHGVEELLEPPYLFLPGEVNYKCTDQYGVTREISNRRHNFKKEGRRIEQRYDRVQKVMAEGALSHGRVLAAESFLLDARALWDTAEAVMRQDPLFFVDYPDSSRDE